MGGALIVETYALIEWIKTTFPDFGPFGFSGMSMGGQTSALCGTALRMPVAMTLITAPVNGGTVFTDGLLRDCVDWALLQSQMADMIKQGLAEHDVDAQQFMRNIMELTDLRNYPLPLIPEGALHVAAEYDRFIIKDPWLLHSHWKGSHLKTIKRGHVTSNLMLPHQFARDIYASFQALAKHYPK